MAERRGVLLSKQDPRERTRRRFARRQWARRWLTWRFVVAGVVLVAGLGLGVYAVWFSDWLRVEGAEVVGLSQLSEEEVLDAADIPTGEPLARADLDAVAERVERLDTVASVDVSRQWPHELRIEVVERDPVAVVPTAQGFTQVDDEGWRFGTLREPGRLPVIEIGADADRNALSEAAAVAGALPDEVAALVDHIDVRTVDEITLTLRDEREVRWGSADDSDAKGEVLLALLGERGDFYDVSVPGMPTVR